MQRHIPMHNDPKSELDPLNEMIHVECSADLAASLEAEAGRPLLISAGQDSSI